MKIFVTFYIIMISTIYKTSRSALSDANHEAIAECFGSDKARTASFVNVSEDESLYTRNPYESVTIYAF